VRVSRRCHCSERFWTQGYVEAPRERPVSRPRYAKDDASTTGSPPRVPEPATGGKAGLLCGIRKACTFNRRRTT